MITLELISRKRNPIKRNAFILIVVGFLILITICATGQVIGNTIKIMLMISTALIFIVSLFIINYSYKFKKVIGSVSFSKDYIEITIFQRKEIIHLDQLKIVHFKLTGYEGLNKSTIFENIIFPLTRFAYHSGINNFLYLNSGKNTRCFEFFIPNKSVWIEIKNIAKQYHEKLEKT